MICQKVLQHSKLFKKKIFLWHAKILHAVNLQILIKKYIIFSNTLLHGIFPSTRIVHINDRCKFKFKHKENIKGSPTTRMAMHTNNMGEV